MSLFEPMLAATIEDVNALRFPVLVSQKLDGVRATVQGGQLLSRSLKPIPNPHVQELFSNLSEGLDGELIVGDPLAPDAYRKTMSLVMSDKPLTWFAGEPIRFHVFDKYGDEGFLARYDQVTKWAKSAPKAVVIVKQSLIQNVNDLDTYEADLLERGAEGVMVRDPQGGYKQGRSTLNQQWLMKLKRFVDFESRVVGTYELEHNDNVAFTNELGRTARSSHAAGKVGGNALGGLELVGVGGAFDGVAFRCGTGFDASMRREYWDARENLIGQFAKIKSFPSGGKDKPRHPVFLGWRSKLDLGEL